MSRTSRRYAAILLSRGGVAVSRSACITPGWSSAHQAGSYAIRPAHYIVDSHVRPRLLALEATEIRFSEDIQVDPKS